MLLLLEGVVVREVPASLFNVILQESRLVTASVEVSLRPLNFNFTLVKHRLRVEDVAVNSVSLLAQVCIGSLQVLKVGLEDFNVSGLLVELLFIVALQISDAVF